MLPTGHGVGDTATLSPTHCRTLAAAKLDAKSNGGFEAVSDYWTVTKDGLTTQRRPGKPSVIVPAGADPKN